MNLTAVLDAMPQRGATPLDRAVGESPDPEFANVMSRVRKDGDKTPADSGAAARNTAEASTCRRAAGESKTRSGETCDRAAADAKRNEVDTKQQPADTEPTASGEPLPVTGPDEGRTLPGDDAPSDAAAAPLPSELSDADSETLDGDAAAALLFGAAPTPPPPPTPAVVNVAPPLQRSVGLDQGARAPAARVETPAREAQNALDATQPPTDVDPLRAAGANKTGDSRAANATPLGLAQTAPQTIAAQQAMAAQTAQQPATDASIAQTLRALVRPQTLGTEPPSGKAAPRDLRAQSIVAPGAAGPSKASMAQFASLVEGTVEKDRAAPQQDPVDGLNRSDAITQRANGMPEVPRDAAAARLNDLAQLHTPRFVGELADRVLVLRGQRFDTATMTLEPRELGRIDIQVRLQADTTHVAFTAQHAAVRDALEGHMPRLRAMLEDAGLSLGTVDISHSGGQSGTDAGASRSFEPQKSSGPAIDAVADQPNSSRRRVENALIDLHA